jgi:hypothetical protein
MVVKKQKFGENNMQITVTFDFDLIRTELHNSFTNKYKSNWVDQDNPTDAEITKAIKDETLEGLENDNRVLTFEVVEN